MPRFPYQYVHATSLRNSPQILCNKIIFENLSSPFVKIARLNLKLSCLCAFVPSKYQLRQRLTRNCNENSSCGRSHPKK